MHLAEEDRGRARTTAGLDFPTLPQKMKWRLRICAPDQLNHLFRVIPRPIQEERLSSFPSISWTRSLASGNPVGNTQVGSINRNRLAAFT